MPILPNVRHEDYITNRVLEAIRAALQPFPIDRGEIWLEEGIFGFKIKVKTTRLDSYPFEMTIPDRYYTLHPYEIAAIVSRQAADHYAGVYIPPEDHIILGTD